MIPVIEKEIVENRQWVDGDEFHKDVIVSNITPGALPVKLGALVGYRYAGWIGALFGAFGVALPGTVLTLVLLMVISFSGVEAIQTVEMLSVGITVFILYLIIRYISRVVFSPSNKRTRIISIVILMLAFLLSGGQEIRALLVRVFNIDIGLQSIFNVSAINLIIVAFFLVLLVGFVRTRLSLVLGGMVSLAYLIAVGEVNLVSSNIAIYLLCGMLLLVIGAFYYRHKHRIKEIIPFAKQQRRNAFITVSIITLVVALYLIIQLTASDNREIKYIADVALSTTTAFGGGAAYIPVADGIFVQGGYLDAEVFYRQVVPVVNALPGPFLVKLACAVGFIAFAGHSVLGWIMAAVAFITCIGLCTGISIAAFKGFNAFLRSGIVKNLQLYVLPVVCGLLLSTCLSMLNETTQIVQRIGMASWAALGCLCLLVGLIFLVNRMFKIKEVITLVVITSACFLVQVLLI